jgi:hypothetical protein
MFISPMTVIEGDLTREIVASIRTYSDISLKPVHHISMTLQGGLVF